MPDMPDLGAFTNVFRALNDFQQPRNGIPIPIAQVDHGTPTSLAHLSPTGTSHTLSDSHSVVWTHSTAVSYLSNSWQDTVSFRSPTFRSSSRTRSLSENLSDDSDTEGEELLPSEVDTRPFNIDAAIDFLQHEAGEPSLGYLDEALGFIAAERARFVASRDVAPKDGGRSSTSETAWRHVIQPRRKRRRKKFIKSHSQGPLLRIPLAGDGPDTADQATAGEEGTVDDSSSSSVEISSSSPAQKISPVTARSKEQRKHVAGPDGARLLHTRSTPSLRLIPFSSTPLDPRLLKLRALAHKLRLLFPTDAARLASILSNDKANQEDFVDPRGPIPQSKDTLVHVFVDQFVLVYFPSFHDLTRDLVQIFL